MARPKNSEIKGVVLFRTGLRMEKKLALAGRVSGLFTALFCRTALNLPSEKLSELALDIWDAMPTAGREFSFLGGQNCKIACNIDVFFPRLSENIARLRRPRRQNFSIATIKDNARKYSIIEVENHAVYKVMDVRR